MQQEYLKFYTPRFLGTGRLSYAFNQMSGSTVVCRPFETIFIHWYSAKNIRRAKSIWLFTDNFQGFSKVLLSLLYSTCSSGDSNVYLPRRSVLNVKSFMDVILSSSFFTFCRFTITFFNQQPRFTHHSYGLVQFARYCCRTSGILQRMCCSCL